MEKKIYFPEGLRASNSIGFNRPAVSIENANVIEVRTAGAKKNYAIFFIDIKTALIKWVSPVEELMGLATSPFKFENNRPFIELDGLRVTVPSDRSQPISFSYSE